MTTKNELVLSAYEELRISGLTSDPSSEDIKLGVKRLDMMILGWQNLGLCLSYVRSVSFFDTDPNQDSGLNDVNAHAVILNLAKTLCPAFGKQLHPDTRAEARKSYLGLFSSDLTYREPDHYQPTGSGHSFGYGYDDRFRFQAKADNAPENCDTMDIIIGQTDFYTIDFTNEVEEVEGDSISSFTVEDGQGVQVNQSTQDGNTIILDCTGLTEGYAPVKITASFALGRVLPQTISFNVTKT
jgi:hypothetical protein